MALNISENSLKKREFLKQFNIIHETKGKKMVQEKKKIKPLLNTPLLNDFSNIIKEKKNEVISQFFTSLPEERREKKNNFGNVEKMLQKFFIKKSREQSFLPFTLLKLEDFHQKNMEVLRNNSFDNLIHPFFKAKSCGELNFLKIYYFCMEQKCASKKCLCVKNRLLNGKVKGIGFTPTKLTPIVEEVDYI